MGIRNQTDEDFSKKKQSKLALISLVLCQCWSPKPSPLSKDASIMFFFSLNRKIRTCWQHVSCMTHSLQIKFPTKF